MKKRFWITGTLLFVLPVFMLTTSCAKKAMKKDVSLEQKKAEDEAAKLAAEKAAEKKRLEEERLQQEKMEAAAAERKALAARNGFENEHVYFDYDSSAMDKTAQETLLKKAEWLRNNPDAAIVIEGHCDERGTGEYNLALGDRRAENVKDFLLNIGVDATRLTTISYGEERPLDSGQNEEAWAKNRRGQFLIE